MKTEKEKMLASEPFKANDQELMENKKITKEEYELYERRKINVQARTNATVNVENRRKGKFARKLILQCVVCLIIYASFYPQATTTYFWNILKTRFVLL